MQATPGWFCPRRQKEPDLPSTTASTAPAPSPTHLCSTPPGPQRSWPPAFGCACRCCRRTAARGGAHGAGTQVRSGRLSNAWLVPRVCQADLLLADNTQPVLPAAVGAPASCQARQLLHFVLCTPGTCSERRRGPPSGPAAGSRGVGSRELASGGGQGQVNNSPCDGGSYTASVLPCTCLAWPAETPHPSS